MATRPKIVRLALFVVLGAILAVSACASTANGWPGDVGSRSRSTASIYGEVRSIDHRRGRMQIREDWGKNRTVYYDGRTRVVYGSRHYPVSSLERGDLVRVHVIRSRNGGLYADRVDVRQSVRNRGIDRRVERMAGTVVRVDGRRRSFVLEPSRSRSVVVHVPGRLRREDARRLERLRRGDRVRVEVRAIGRNSVELIRFR